MIYDLIDSVSDLKKGGPQGPLRFGKRRSGPSGPLRFGKRSQLNYPLLYGQPPYNLVE
ncbi:unnamed protein product [Angiostrongylus costaricensis]|uniref:Uncharacterized protein n=1 Tax=Angiostrongylus costaricensis TaxID=334426 RepID=A0A0R3PPR8_ANGCS|nr:unnamed protein product [Angiostrongylus costaricensis]